METTCSPPFMPRPKKTKKQHSAVSPLRFLLLKIFRRIRLTGFQNRSGQGFDIRPLYILRHGKKDRSS